MRGSEAKILDLEYELSGTQEVKQPLELHVSKKHGISRELSAQLACSVAIIAMLSIAYIGTNLRLYEITSEISSVSTDYNALLSENQRASVALESKVSLRSVENSAIATMGMGKVESYQVEYVNLSDSDTVEVAPTKMDPIIEKVNAMIKVFKDYIGL